MKKLRIFSAIFFLLFSLAISNFVSADSQSPEESADENIQKILDRIPEKKHYKSRQRPIMIQGAMNVEIDRLVRTLKNPVAYKFSKYVYFAGTYKNYPVVIVRTEQGMSNAAASTVIGINEFNPVAVINQGTAGGHDYKVHVNDIVIGEKTFETFAIKTDFNAAGDGVGITNQEMRGVYAYDHEQKTFRKYTEFLADPKLFRIAKQTADEHKEFNVTVGTIATADAWLENVDYINFLNEKYSSTCEEMETHAAAHICQNLGVPFIGIRVISDNCLNYEDWDVATAYTGQDFVLLVVEKLIEEGNF